MGLFRRSVGSAEPPERRRVSRLRTGQDWVSLLELSRLQPVLVFKHSTSCGISGHVLAQVEAFLDQHPSTPVAIVHVLEDRPISARITEDMEIRHKSPQLIAIENQRPIWHASHWAIDLDDLASRLSVPN